MKQNCCANCKHWAGDSNAYAAPCTNLDVAISRPYYDHVCDLHEARTPDPNIAMQSAARGMFLWPSAGSAGSPHNPPCPQCGSNFNVRRVGQEWFCGADVYYWK